MTAPTTLDYCDRCAQEVPVLVAGIGSLVCDDCRHCYVCSESVAGTLTLVGEQVMCDGCHNDLAACDSCSTRVLYSSDLRSTLSGVSVCESCADELYTCDECGDLGGEDDLTHTQDGSTVCDDCRYSDYHACEHCEEWIRDGDCCEDEDCQYRDSSGDYGGMVRDYGYKPEPRFHGSGRVFLGMELEVNHADYSCAEIATNELGSLGYLKEDSSLDDGFEIVTHPMTHAYAAEDFPWSMLTALRNEGARSSGAGLHVHVNRSAFDGPSHVYRWLRLVYRNEQALTALSRRGSYELNEWAAFDRYTSRAAKEHAKGSRGGKRHAAVNVTNNATFEVRLFASSLRRQSVRAALDFVDASVEYTRHLTVPVILAGGWAWAAFRTWVGEREEYAALTAEMGRRATTERETVPPRARRIGWERPNRPPVRQVPARDEYGYVDCPCQSCREATTRIEV